MKLRIIIHNHNSRGLLVFLTFAFIFILFVLYLMHLLSNLHHPIDINYRVVGPRVIRPNSEYHVAVSTQRTSIPTSVTVSLLGRQHDGRVFSTEQSLVVEPYTTRIARLEVGDVEPGDYRLLARGNGGVSFDTSTVLTYRKKSYSVFIQTDKSVYKPGHKILFRALVLNSGLRPAAEVRNEPIHIKISDGKGNVVKQWRGVTATRGVFTGDLQLSKQPVLGNWNISVTLHGQVFNKTIQVAEYMLPKFLINIQTKKHVTFSENTIFANIQSQYSYGKKVKGDATVTMYPIIRSGVIQPIYHQPIRKVLPIDGSLTVDFDITKDLRLSDEYERAVIVDVTIEEALTGRRQNNSVEVHLHKYEYQMELIKTANYFKPGLRYTAYIKVFNHDGSPITDDMKSVIVRHGYTKANEIYKEHVYKLDRNGIVEITFDPPTDATNQTALRIEAEYQNLKEWFSPIPPSISPSRQYIQATLQTDRPIVNQDVEILLNCTEPLSYVSYELLARGDVIVANTLQIRNEQTYRFHFTATHAMVPTAHLIVSYVREDGEIVADSLDIQVDGLLQNFIDIQLNSVETRPGNDIDMIIRAQPNSYIGLLAIDQNVGLLKSGHDITQNQIAEELYEYDIASLSPYLAILKDQRKHFSWKPGSSNTKDMFYDAGAAVLTNSAVNNYRPTLEDIYVRPPQYGSSTVKPDRGPGFSFGPGTRPPLAGPYAFSRIPRPVWDKPRVYLNHDIQDTWLFNNFSSGFEGKTSIRKRVPDSLTTWTITGFSLDPLRGLGLINSPRKLKVSKPFVVSLDLPYSVQRGEVLSIPVVVFNYREVDITAEITIHNNEQKFDFVPVIGNEPNSTKRIELYRKKSVIVKRNSGASVAFMVKPNELGQIAIKVTANSGTQSDTATKNLFVKAEGETQYYSKSILLDLRQTNFVNSTLELDIPKNAVPGSEMIEVAVVGDLLGPAIVNLDRLITIPTGCGEQNMMNFVPNVIVLNYLRNTRQLTPSIERDAIANLEIGYQQQLSYRGANGSFSEFRKMDSNGSVWLTALVAHAFKQAQPYIYIERKIIKEALEWLASKQAPNGSFPETGNVIHRKIQSLDGNSLALTAFVSMAFLENREIFPNYERILDDALSYIGRNINEGEDTYTVAIVSYVLQKANHPSKRLALSILETKAKANATKNFKWWGEDIPKSEEKNPWQFLPKSIDIEMTSYGLLSYIEANLIDDAIPVINWLISQENPFGGFASSQDTIVGLLAVAELTEKLFTNTNMQVKFSYKKQESNNIGVNKNNAMIIQKFKIGSNVREVNVTAQGSGFVLFRVNYQYNMNVTGPWPMFTLDPQVDKNSNIHHLQLSICTGFVSRNLSAVSESNMAVMEVNFPSGFTADVDSLPSLEVSQNVKLVETKNKDTTVILYFEKMVQQEYCPTVSAFRTHKVARQKPVHVMIYDYYDTSRKARVFYQAHPATLCNICEEEDCEKVCTTEPERIGADSEGKGHGSVTNPINSAIFAISVIYLFLTYN